MAGLPHIYPSPGDGIEELPAPASDTAPAPTIDGPAVPIATDPATGEPCRSHDAGAGRHRNAARRLRLPWPTVRRDLLNYLQRLEQDSASFANSVLGRGTRNGAGRVLPRALRHRGRGLAWWSRVTCKTPWSGYCRTLLDIFTSTDEAVQFDPARRRRRAGAQQATDTCNYIFYRQNNGFVDALHGVQGCASLEELCRDVGKVTERVKTSFRCATPPRDADARAARSGRRRGN